MNSSQDLYSEARLADWLRANGQGAVERIVDGMVEDVKKFEGGASQADDLTIMALAFHGAAAGTVRSETLRMELTNQLAEVARLNTAFSEYAEDKAVPKRAVGQFQLMFDELLTNIISHAYSDAGEHRILVEVRFSVDRIAAKITDDGKPFNPLKYGAPPIEASIDERQVGGLGIHLVRNVMDEVIYHRASDKNIVEAVKHLDGSA
jgi:sigma-B regulation protein RsbU (phosphoserine phosphatase)